MAIARNGLLGHHTGKIGNKVYYMLEQRNVVRGIGINKKPRTELQKKNQQGTKIRNEFFSQINEFLKTGFSIEKIGTGMNAFNRAQHYNGNNIMTGTYPDQKIAYDQVVLSKGKLKPAQNWAVDLLPDGIAYTWATDQQMAWPEASDQVMMLAYFPEENEATYSMYGNSRFSGSDFLKIPDSLIGKYMETYVSFIAADRSQLANSTYTGAFHADDQNLNNQGAQLLLF